MKYVANFIHTVVTTSPYLLFFFYQVFRKAFLFGARKTKSKNFYNVFLTILGKFEEQGSLEGKLEEEL